MSNDFLASRENVENLIFNVRGKQVMLDSDLARLYGCKNGTKTINQAVGRHLDRFPEDFCFQLTDEECGLLWFQNGTANNWGDENLKSQLGTSSVDLRSQVETANLKFQTETSNSWGGRRKAMHAFTEQGVAMLATVLRTEVAAKTSISIMRAFVAMRKYMATDLIAQKHINDLVLEDHDRIKLLETSFKKFEEKQKDTEIYFNGQIYDAYSKILDIFKEAKHELIIVDAYADKSILDIVKNIKVKVIIITRKNNLLHENDIKKYNQQYKNLTVIYNNTFHDRYFVIDSETFYHCGASMNRLGVKTFSITKIGDSEISEKLSVKLAEIMV